MCSLVKFFKTLPKLERSPRNINIYSHICPVPKIKSTIFKTTVSETKVSDFYSENLDKKDTLFSYFKNHLRFLCISKFEIIEIRLFFDW